MGAVAVVVVALSAISLALAPKNRRAMGPTPLAEAIRVDTAPLLVTLGQAQTRVVNAESALVVVRQQVLAAARQPVDTLDPKAQARHDTLTNILTELQELIGKVETIPLPSSYRALASSPALVSNGRVKALLDSLSEIERERDGYGADGGADPMYVALTSQATDIGRAIETIAGQRRDSLKAEILRMTMPSRQVASAAAAAPPDTMPWLAERDSARSAVTTAASELASAREALRLRAEETARAKQIAAISASPFAIAIAAAVIGVFLGFAFTLWQEIHSPRVSDGTELEKATGARLMATVTHKAKPDTYDRRKADRLAPGYLDPHSDAYQLGYLHIEQSAATPDLVPVLGDDPDVSAVVAMNLAAIAAEDARTVLVIDSAGRSEALRKLLPFSATADLVELIGGIRPWVDATAHVSVGRDRTVDLVTARTSAAPADLIQLIDRERARLGRTYDIVFVIGDLALIEPLAAAKLAEGVIVTATAGKTRLAKAVAATRILREAGQRIFGVLLWDAPPPRLTSRPKRETGGRRQSAPPSVRQPQAA
jgi:hypothetical protein